LDLLQKLYSEVLIPEGVYEEVTHSIAMLGAKQIKDATWLCRAQLSPPPDPFLLGDLGRGEAEVISLALEKKADRVLIDERKGRRIAELIYHLRVTGSGGILLKAKKSGYIEAVRPLMGAMRKNGYYLADNLLNSICQAAGE
jgi:predicted nucleic acid-binding protein